MENITNETHYSLKPVMKKRRKKHTPGQIALKIGFYLLLLVLCIIFLFPVVWMVSNSFKTQAEVFATINSLKTFLPASFDITKWFVSYGNLFHTFEYFGQSILNSLLYCAVTILGVLLINSFAGYALSRFVFPGHKSLVNIIILILIVPVETSIVPLYIILKNLGLLNSQLRVIGYLIPGLVSPFYIFMFRSFFLGIPKELEEAAYVDGSSILGTYFKVIFPLALPVFATVAVFTFMGSWNEYIFAQLMFANPAQQPLQVFLQLINNFNPKDISLVMASLTFSTIPIAIVYIFAQRYIVEGVAFTGLK